MLICLRIGLVVAGIANIVLAIFLWRQIGKDASDVRRTFWQSTMSANHNFLTGILFLAMAKVFPTTDAVCYWLSAGMAISCGITYYPQYRDRWMRNRPNKAAKEMNEPERIHTM